MPEAAQSSTITTTSDYAVDPLPGARLETTAAVALGVALCSLPLLLIGPLVAFAMGSAGKRNIKASNGYRHGKGLCTASQMIALVFLVLQVLSLVLIGFY